MYFAERFGLKLNNYQSAPQACITALPNRERHCRMGRMLRQKIGKARSDSCALTPTGRNATTLTRRR